MTWSKPVSYTHLDVYKRQRFGCGSGAATRTAAGMNAKRGFAVFFLYDVLDVWSFHEFLLFADLDDVSGLQRFVSRAAFGIQKLQNFLERFGVGRVAQERAFALHADQVFIFQLVEVMRERGIRDIQFSLNVADDEAFRMRREEHLHDAQARLSAHGGKHVGVLGDALAIFLGLGDEFRLGGGHISIFAAIWVGVKAELSNARDLDFGSACAAWLIGGAAGLPASPTITLIEWTTVLVCLAATGA